MNELKSKSSFFFFWPKLLEECFNLWWNKQSNFGQKKVISFLPHTKTITRTFCKTWNTLAYVIRCLFWFYFKAPCQISGLLKQMVLRIFKISTYLVSMTLNWLQFIVTSCYYFHFTFLNEYRLQMCGLEISLNGSSRLQSWYAIFRGQFNVCM